MSAFFLALKYQTLAVTDSNLHKVSLIGACSLLQDAAGVRQGNEEDLIVAPKQPCGRIIQPIIKLGAVKALSIRFQRKSKPQCCVESAPACGKASKRADIEALFG